MMMLRSSLQGTSKRTGFAFYAHILILIQSFTLPDSAPRLKRKEAALRTPIATLAWLRIPNGTLAAFMRPALYIGAVNGPRVISGNPETSGLHDASQRN